MEQKSIAMKIDSLAKIPDFNYEGYVWFSNEKSPERLDNKPFTYRSIPENPFIIEALLWASKEKIAIHIVHTDKYLIHKYEAIDDKMDIVKYLPHHRLNGVKKVKFKQLWIPESDPLCEGMEVLTMKAQIFVGFEK